MRAMVHKLRQPKVGTATEEVGIAMIVAQEHPNSATVVSKAKSVVSKAKTANKDSTTTTNTHAHTHNTTILSKATAIGTAIGIGTEDTNEKTESPRRISHTGMCLINNNNSNDSNVKKQSSFGKGDNPRSVSSALSTTTRPSKADDDEDADAIDVNVNVNVNVNNDDEHDINGEELCYKQQQQQQQRQQQEHSVDQAAPKQRLTTPTPTLLATTTRTASILRTSFRYTNKASATTTTTTTPPSPKPSTGRKVRGLWSPSVSVEGDSSSKNDAPNNPSRDSSCSTKSSSEAHELGQGSPAPSPLDDHLRDETLTEILSYLPLADLLRAGRVSRRWRHQVHQRGGDFAENNRHRKTTTTTTTTNKNNNKGKRNHDTKQIIINNTNNNDTSNATIYNKNNNNDNIDTNYNSNYSKKSIHLWERVDATSFIQETYDRFLEIGTKRQQQQKEELHNSLLPLVKSITTTPKQPTRQKQKQKKQITTTADPLHWARLQTGLALGRVLHSKTTPPRPTTTTTNASKQPRTTQANNSSSNNNNNIRVLVLRNIGDKLCSNHLDDFLSESLLSSLRELTLSGFESLTDTHVHVLLLLLAASSPVKGSSGHHHHKKGPAARLSSQAGAAAAAAARCSHHELEALSLEDCQRLTSKTLVSIAKTCGHNQHFRKLSVKGCSGIDSIDPLSDLLVTKLFLPGGGVSAPPRSVSPIGCSSDQRTTSSVPGGSATTALVHNNTTQVDDAKTISSSLWFEPPRSAITARTTARAAPGLPFDSSLPRNTTTTTTTTATSTTKTNTLASLFAQPPKNTTIPTPAGLSSLFAPPPVRSTNTATTITTTSTQHHPASAAIAPPDTSITAAATTTTSPQQPFRGRSSSRSTLASLFDPPGTSPTRMNNAESMRILPPPPSFPTFETLGKGGTTKQSKPTPKQTSNSDSRTTTMATFGTNVSISTAGSMVVSPGIQQSWQSNIHGHPFGKSPVVASKRYHRHQRSLSNGKLPFPPALLPDSTKELGGNDCHHHRGPVAVSARTNTTLGGGGASRRERIVVGNLGSLDLRGTAIHPSKMIACLWSLTHHHHSGEESSPSWCSVWFEALHLNGELATLEASDRKNQRPDSTMLWSSENLARLETMLAMDEMERKRPRGAGQNSSNSSDFGGLSYVFAAPNAGS